MILAQHENFERWISRAYPSVSLGRTVEDGEYASSAAFFAWYGWQAAVYNLTIRSEQEDISC